MAVPKKKTSRSRTGMRRSHHAIKFSAAVDYCPSCSAPKLRHHICKGCGAYRGMQILPAPLSAAAEVPPAE